ncbi:hypothetical protein [Sporolactobacillus terrae]|uniref:hypothetical protein n=1 Tax=Sporolactobacillus terrae TaxID=269673 RepID=UPI00048CF80F|nr:hypothetical protein [Sporolactobacillus terrae]
MPSKYDTLISIIQLNDIYVSKLKCSRNKKFQEQNHSLKVHLEYDVKSIEQTGIEIIIPVFFRVAPYYAGEKGETPFNKVNKESILFSIECTLELKYMIAMDENPEKQDMTDFETEFQTFAENNVPVNVWPYARELFSSLSTRMGLSSLVIPVFKKLPKY